MIFIATYKRKLKDRSGNYVVPATRASCVYLDDNKNLQDWIDDQEASAFDPLTIFPVGFIYQSTGSTSPASLFGGSWEKIQNRFLYGAGGSYGVGNTGGEESHVLNMNEMPSHNHGRISLVGDIWGGDTRLFAENSYVTGIFSRRDNGDDKFELVRKDGLGTSVVPDIHLDASHQHNMEGSGWAHNNMPPYFVCNIWRRTA